MLTDAPEAGRMTKLRYGRRIACGSVLEAGRSWAGGNSAGRCGIRRHGGLVLTGKAVDLKSTGPRGSWGFESLALRLAVSAHVLPVRYGLGMV
jgi:hypothetical protein